MLVKSRMFTLATLLPIPVHGVTAHREGHSLPRFEDQPLPIIMARVMVSRARRSVLTLWIVSYDMFTGGPQETIRYCSIT